MRSLPDCFGPHGHQQIPQGRQVCHLVIARNAGCGTLGCEVARCLLAWGVESLHLVDNSHVAFSNPIRQSLYTFQDCLHGGAAKAEAAVRALQCICPSAHVQSSVLTIPMPGHPPVAGEEAQMQQACACHTYAVLLSWYHHFQAEPWLKFFCWKSCDHQ